jgi:hypothetical protein
MDGETIRRLETKLDQISTATADNSKALTEMTVLLKGYNGFPGLLKDIKKLEEDFVSYIKHREDTCVFKKFGEARLEKGDAKFAAIDQKLTILEEAPRKKVLKTLGWAAAIIVAVFLSNIASYTWERMFVPKVPTAQVNE